MSKRTVVQLLGLTVVMAVTVVARPVAANPQMIRERAVSMGVDVGAAITRSEGVDSTTGPGFLVRAGYEFGTGVTPELILSYSHWNRTLLGFDVTESQVSVLPGVRWSILGGAMILSSFRASTQVSIFSSSLRSVANESSTRAMARLNMTSVVLTPHPPSATAAMRPDWFSWFTLYLNRDSLGNGLVRSRC